MKKGKMKFFQNIGIYLLIIAAVVSVLLVVSPYDDEQESKEEIVLRNEKESVVEAEVFTVASGFKLNENEDVKKLVSNYYNALIKADDSSLMRFVDDINLVSKEQRMLYSEYVEDVHNIDTYVVDGTIENTYVVVAVSYIKIKGANTLVPMLDKFFVMTNTSGNIYITTKELSESQKSYNELMYESAAIKNVAKRIAVAYDEALDREDYLKEVFYRVGNGVN